MLKRKLTALILAISIIISPFFTIYAIADELVFAAPITNTFTAGENGNIIIDNLLNQNLGAHIHNEPIMHAMSLGFISAGSGTFFPDAPVTIQQAIRSAVNILGEGATSHQGALDLTTTPMTEAPLPVGARTNPELDPRTFTLGTTDDMLYLGYLEVARANNIISNEMFLNYTGRWDDSPAPTRFSSATLDTVALLVARAISLNNEDILDLPNQPQAVHNFVDWQDIAFPTLPYVEALARLDVLRGGIFGRMFGSNLNPQGPITQGELALMIRQLGPLVYDANDFYRHTGTIAAFRTGEQLENIDGENWNLTYIRRSDGAIDVFQSREFLNQGIAPHLSGANVPVFRNGTIGGLETLELNDQIEYIVNTTTNEVVYINVIFTDLYTREIIERLHRVDLEEGTITLRAADGHETIHRIAHGLFGINDQGAYLMLDGRLLQESMLPIGSFVSVNIQNELVRAISFIGLTTLVNEVSGIVIDNNPAFGYLTVMEAHGQIVTRFYHTNNMRVQRQSHYQQGGVGYIAHMFLYFNFNPLEANIADLRPGDIVHMRLDPSDYTIISSISAAAPAYRVRHGTIRHHVQNGDVAQLLIQFDNGQTSWLDLGSHVFITRAGSVIHNRDIMIGDRLRLLVNQAILAPGHMVESVLEAQVESPGHHISTIVNGSMAGINPIQNQLMIRDSRHLTIPGWGPSNNIEEFNVSDRNIEFFHNGNRITQDHANRFFSRANNTTYVALDDAPFGQTIRQITFRDGRDELLNPDEVISINGNGGFTIPSVNGLITTDAGTIVRRYGRLVSGTDIAVGDMVRVSLNGANLAAVVDITPRPGVSAINIARVRIENIINNQSFSTTAMSNLSGDDWLFTPVERIFTIGPSTLFLDEEGFVDPSTFITYTEDSLRNRTFTVIYDGAFATHVIDAPFANRAVRGTIMNIETEADQSTILINYATYLNNYVVEGTPTHQWHEISRQDPTMNILTAPNTIFIRNNNVVQLNDLQLGDRIRVLTTSLPTMISGVEIPGYIILVER